MVFTLFMSRFSTSRMKCFALKFKQKQRKHSMTLRDRMNHFRARSKRLASKPNAKTLKFSPNDNSRHIQLINLEP